MVKRGDRVIYSFFCLWVPLDDVMLHHTEIAFSELFLPCACFCV